jgi:hypothetical protein
MNEAASVDLARLLWFATLAVLLLVAGFVFLVIAKGRPRPGRYVYRASRLSSGNHLLPSQVIIGPESITHYHPQWIGKLEKSIHIAHIASVRIDTHIIFSDVYIETTGGQNPIACHGHSRRDAVRIKSTIERFQSEYYRDAQDRS